MDDRGAARRRHARFVHSPSRHFVCADAGLGAGPSAIPNPKSEIQDEDVLDLQSQLVEKSLVLCEVGEGEPRYRMLETVRQYAAEHLRESGETPLVRRRHRDWYLDLARQAEAGLAG